MHLQSLDKMFQTLSTIYIRVGVLGFGILRRSTSSILGVVHCKYFRLTPQVGYFQYTLEGYTEGPWRSIVKC